MKANQLEVWNDIAILSPEPKKLVTFIKITAFLGLFMIGNGSTIPKDLRLILIQRLVILGFF
jgi:hypothetical protein